MKKTLLLNSTYEVLSFISERKAFKLLFKDKCEVIGEWDEIINWGNTKIYHPSILRLKSHIRRNFARVAFSRRTLMMRDNNSCQYCGEKLSPSQITIDHIVPKSHGGTTCFTNCAICCRKCNIKKANRTPEQAGMILLKKPIVPIYSCMYDMMEQWNDDWNMFFD